MLRVSIKITLGAAAAAAAAVSRLHISRSNT